MEEQQYNKATEIEIHSILLRGKTDYKCCGNCDERDSSEDNEGCHQTY